MHKVTSIPAWFSIDLQSQVYNNHAAVFNFVIFLHLIQLMVELLRRSCAYSGEAAGLEGKIQKCSTKKSPQNAQNHQLLNAPK